MKAGWRVRYDWYVPLCVRRAFLGFGIRLVTHYTTGPVQAASSLPMGGLLYLILRSWVYPSKAGW
jgi:hypothetical protein